MKNFRIIQKETGNGKIYFEISERMFLWIWVIWDTKYEDIEEAKKSIKRQIDFEYQERHPNIVYSE